MSPPPPPAPKRETKSPPSTKNRPGVSPLPEEKKKKKPPTSPITGGGIPPSVKTEENSFTKKIRKRKKKRILSQGLLQLSKRTPQNPVGAPPLSGQKIRSRKLPSEVSRRRIRALLIVDDTVPGQQIGPWRRSIDRGSQISRGAGSGSHR